MFEFFWSHALPSLGCSIVETHAKLIEIVRMRDSVHSTLHVRISVELQHRSVIKLSSQYAMMKENRDFEIIAFVSTLIQEQLY